MNLRTIYKRRANDVRKGDFGHLLIVGGSEQYTGSPIFNAMGALRAGCDLVTIMAPDRAANAAAMFSPDLITVPLPGRYLDLHHVPEILTHLATKHALVIGGGLGSESVTKQANVRIVAECSKPIVVDADALRALKDHSIQFLGKQVILTPHDGEIAYLLDSKVPTRQSERKECAVRLAIKYKAVVLLKGYQDLITDGEKLVVDRVHSPYLTKGGIGDITAGVIGALLARGTLPFQAAQAGACIIGMAGKIAAKHYRESLLASDLLDAIPEVLS